VIIISKGLTGIFYCVTKTYNSMARPIVHGKSKTPEFRAWQCMHQRCYNPNDQRYAIYGGRGILVEDRRWFGFMEFLHDMGQRPANTSLDRIDCNKGYYKGNCRWADIFVQNNNRRNVVLLEYKGEIMPMKHWCDMFGISVQALRYRLKRGDAVKEALETPVINYIKSAHREPNVVS
jgi:hypothetical protein